MATFTAASNRYISHITDLEVAQLNGRTVLISATYLNGGFATYDVTRSDRPIYFLGGRNYPDYFVHQRDPTLAVINRDGTDFVYSTNLRNRGHALTVNSAAAPSGYQRILNDNMIGNALIGIGQFETPKGSFVYTSALGSLSFDIYRDTARGLQHVSAPVVPLEAQRPDATLDKVQVTQVQGSWLMVGISGQGNFLSLHRLGADGAVLSADYLGTAEGTGFNRPNDFQLVTVNGASFVVLTSVEASALTVMRLLPGGGIVPVDHVIDELTTRFQHATALATATVNGRVFVFAGGNDDGITMFTMQPDGRLLFLQTLVDSDTMTLNNVADIAARVIDGKIVLFVASKTEPGITQLEVDPGNIGQTRFAGLGRVTGTAGNDLLAATSDTDALHGGAGDDILIGGDTGGDLTGGAGADVFVPHAQSGRTYIRDYQPGFDRIDLSQMGYLRSIYQLRVASHSHGAVLSWAGAEIVVTTAGGRSLSAGDFSNAMFPVAHYELPSEPTVVMGSAGNNTLRAARAGSHIRALGGHDLVFGGFADDRLEGGDGNDSMFGGGGLDRMWGGGGRDMLRGGLDGDTLDGGAGADLLFGDAGDDHLTGGDGDDRLFAGRGNDRVQGGAGNDQAMLGAGQDTAEGGGGNDWFSGEDGDDLIRAMTGQNTLLGGAGNDRLITGDGADLLIGGGGDDVLTGGGGADRLRGDDGHDRLTGGAGGDDLQGGAGNDWLDGGAGRNLLDGGAGADTLLGGAEADTLDGGDQDDRLRGGAGADSLLGGAGLDRLEGDADQDVLRGGGGADTLLGGDGNDLLDGGDGDDDLSGGAGQDMLRGGGGADTLLGGDGNDLLDGGDGDDDLSGDAGQDVLRGGGGSDVLSGGGGHDRLSDASGDDSLAGGDGDDVIQDLAGHNRLSGGAGDDMISGGGLDDRVSGDDGADRLLGGDGQDSLFGGEGADSLGGGAGDDQLWGEAGADLLAGGKGDDRLDGGAGDDSLVGDDGADALAGGTGDDTLDGGAGADLLEGGEGFDRLRGGDGGDRLSGGGGIDSLSGGAGADTLDGGAGTDYLTGGAGADVFTVSVADHASPTSGGDVIADFTRGEDRIDLGSFTLTFVGSAHFSAEAQLRLDQQADRAILLADLDGDGLADLMLDLPGVSDLDDSDLML